MKFAHFIRSDNFTSIYKELQSDLIIEGKVSRPRELATYELLNVNLVLDNPRDRILYSKVRKHNYTYGAAEFIWYIAGVNYLDFITFYLPRMKDYSDDGKTLNSAYGYRIFGRHKDFPNQWRNVQYRLLSDPDTRQAVITIYYQQDLAKQSKDVPCTLNLHFLIREDKLNLFVQMRSNDAYMGLIYDVFSFTLLQEHMYNFLKSNDKFKNLELGTYVHKSDSMHVYERNVVGIYDLLKEKEEDVEDLIPAPSDMVLNSAELNYLKMEERYLREVKIPITVERYSGICRFMAEKLNKILLKK